MPSKYQLAPNPPKITPRSRTLADSSMEMDVSLIFGDLLITGKIDFTDQFEAYSSLPRTLPRIRTCPVVIHHNRGPRIVATTAHWKCKITKLDGSEPRFAKSTEPETQDDKALKALIAFIEATAEDAFRR